MALNLVVASWEALYLGGCQSIRRELRQRLRPSFSHRALGGVTQGGWVSLEPLSSGRNDGFEDVTVCLDWPSTQVCFLSCGPRAVGE